LSQSEEPLIIVSPARHPSSSTKQEDYRPLFHDKHGSPIATIAVNGGFNRVCDGVPTCRFYSHLTLD